MPQAEPATVASGSVHGGTSGSVPRKGSWGVSVLQVTNAEKITEQSLKMLAHVYKHRVAQAAGGLRADIYCQCRNVNLGELLNSAG